MEIKKELNEGTIILKIIGRLDTNTAPLLDEELKVLTKSAKLTIDFSELDYISSAGLRLLLVAKKKFGDGFILKGVKEDVMDVLEMTGFTDILNIE